MPSVFVSYSHDSPEHIQRVLELANALRRSGVMSELDQFHKYEVQHWPNWCGEQLEPDEHDFVICVCTPEYKRRLDKNVDADVDHGVFWEGRLMVNQIYEDKGNSRFIPIQFDAFDETAIPKALKGYTRFRPTEFDHSRDEQFRSLMFCLFGRTDVHQEPVGQLPAFITPGESTLTQKQSAALSAPPVEQLSQQTNFAELVWADFEPEITPEADNPVATAVACAALMLAFLLLMWVTFCS